MTKRHALLAVVAVALGLMLSGCAIYTTQNYGPRHMGSVKTLPECLEKAGGPDLIHEAGGKTVVVYRSLDASQILFGIYTYVEKKDRTIVFDKDGNMISDDVVDKGKGIAILGQIVPVVETE